MSRRMKQYTSTTFRNKITGTQTSVPRIYFCHEKIEEQKHNGVLCVRMNGKSLHLQEKVLLTIKKVIL
jgi:hypothetical protein